MCTHRKCWRRERTLNSAQNILPELSITYRNPQGFGTWQPSCFSRESFYQSILTVQAMASTGLSVFWSFYERCGRTEQRGCGLVTSRCHARTQWVLVHCLSHKIKFPTAERGWKSLFYLRLESNISELCSWSRGGLNYQARHCPWHKAGEDVRSISYKKGSSAGEEGCCQGWQSSQNRFWWSHPRYSGLN